MITSFQTWRLKKHVLWKSGKILFCKTTSYVILVKHVGTKQKIVKTRGVAGIFFQEGQKPGIWQSHFSWFFPRVIHDFPGRNFHFGRQKKSRGFKKWQAKKKKKRKKRSLFSWFFDPSILYFSASLLQFSFISSPFSLFSLPLFSHLVSKHFPLKRGALCPPCHTPPIRHVKTVWPVCVQRSF